jgi:c(7)-type cytochrome triheme protein
MKRHALTRSVQTAIVLVSGLVIASFFVLSYGLRTGQAARAAAVEPAQDFSRSRHDSPQHRRMPCLVCHVRSDNSPTPKMPGHLPCSSCHVQQFADNQNPICTICHTATDVKRFPPLRSFNVRFNHAVHTRQTNCATCHKPARQGVALSIPSGANAHVSCFQCHGPQKTVGDRNIGSCSVCHQPGRPVRISATAKAFSVNFSHAEHARKNLSCSACHTIRPGNARGRQVSEPVAAMHFAPAGTQSCASCHNNKRAFGEDFTQCKRCHEARTFRF